MKKPNDWIYIYYISECGNYTVYDRTVSRTGLGPARAKQRVEELAKIGKEGFYIIGSILPGALS